MFGSLLKILSAAFVAVALASGRQPVHVLGASRFSGKILSFVVAN